MNHSLSWIILLGCIAVIFFFVGVIVFTCKSAARKCDKRIARILKYLERYNPVECSLCENTESLISELKKNKEFSNIAILFRNSLLKYKKNGKDYFCNKNQGSDFFNERTLAYELFYGYPVSPTVLTGLGVLGTFVGLALAMNNLGNDSGQISGLDDFFYAANTAFWTSIIGVVSNILCSILVRHIRRKYYIKILEFSENIDIRYPPNLNSESDLVSIGGVLESNSVQSCVDRMNRDVVQAIRQTSSETANVIAEKVSLYIKDIDDRTSEVIKATLDKLQIELNRSLQSQIENIKLAGEQYIDSTRDATAIIAGKYEEIGNSLNSVHQSILADVTKWTQVAKIISDHAVELTQKVNTLIQKSDESNANVTNCIATAVESINILQNCLNDVKDLTNDVIVSVAELKGASGEISRGIASISNFKPEISKTVDTLLETNKNYAVAWAEQYNKTITCAIENLSNAIDKIAYITKD